MPRYYIDTDDGDLSIIDDAGFDLSGAAEARTMAIDALPDMARDKLPDGDRRTFSVRVRDEQGAMIYSAEMTLVGEWHVRPPAEA